MQTSPQIKKKQFSENPTDNFEHFEPVIQQIEAEIRETAALLLAIHTGVHELNQPMNVLLNLNELLLAEVEADSPLVADLRTMVEQTRRMAEIVRGINRLIYYQTNSYQ
jgi:signal transduction histidine kinase